MFLKPQVTTGNRIAVGLALSLLLGIGNLPVQAQMTGMGQMLKDAADAQQKQADQNKADQNSADKDSAGASTGSDKKDDAAASKPDDTAATKPADTAATKPADEKKDDAAATKSGDDKKDDAKAADSDKKSDKADADTKSDDTKNADKDSGDKKDETADKDKDDKDKDKDDDKTSEEKDREKEQAKIASQKYSPVKEAIVEINSGRAGEAIARLEKLIGKNPKDVQAHYVMAVALVRLRKYSEAANQYHEVLKLVPPTSKVGQLAAEGLQKIAK